MKSFTKKLLLVTALFLLGGCQNTFISESTNAQSKSSKKAITEFRFSSLNVSGTISEEEHSVSMVVPFGTDLKSLTPVIIHTGKGISPSSAVTQDFSGLVTYIVTADDGSSQVYTVSVLVQPEYFVHTPGHGVRYHVIDNYSSNPTNSYYWLVAQDFVTGLNVDLDRVFTFYPEAGYSGSVLGGRTASGFSKLYAGYPSKGLGNFLLLLDVPTTIVDGMAYSNGPSTSYSLAKQPTFTLNGQSYRDCLVITVNQNISEPGSDYKNGTGQLVLSNGLGLIYFHFTRTDGSVATFEIDRTQKFPKTIVSGFVVNGANPVSGKVIQIGNGNWGTRSYSALDGSFVISMYGPTQVVRIGDDNGSNGFNFEGTSPKEFWLHNVEADASGIRFDISALSPIVIN